MVNLFLYTFKALYFEHLVRSITQHFSDLVIVGKRIKQTIRVGKIVDPSKTSGFTGKKKEAKVYNVKGKGYKGKNNYHDNSHNTYNFQIPAPYYS